jgi:hypothetical protein
MPASRLHLCWLRSLDPGLRRDDGVLQRLVTAQRGEVLANTS